MLYNFFFFKFWSVAILEWRSFFFFSIWSIHCPHSNLFLIFQNQVRTSYDIFLFSEDIFKMFERWPFWNGSHVGFPIFMRRLVVFHTPLQVSCTEKAEKLLRKKKEVKTICFHNVIQVLWFYGSLLWPYHLLFILYNRWLICYNRLLIWYKLVIWCNKLVI